MVTLPDLQEHGTPHDKSASCLFIH